MTGKKYKVRARMFDFNIVAEDLGLTVLRPFSEVGLALKLRDRGYPESTIIEVDWCTGGTGSTKITTTIAKSLADREACDVHRRGGAA
jgi:hypothetical protein